MQVRMARLALPGLLLALVAAAAAASGCSRRLLRSAADSDIATPIARQAGVVAHADGESFATEVLAADRPVLVDFYASWCGPCQKLAPQLEELAREMGEAKVVKVNIESDPELAARYGVRSIPSLLVFRNGAVVAEHVGMASQRELEELIRR